MDNTTTFPRGTLAEVIESAVIEQMKEDHSHGIPLTTITHTPADFENR